jgi:hypothetical protein
MGQVIFQIKASTKYQIKSYFVNLFYINNNFLFITQNSKKIFDILEYVC